MQELLNFNGATQLLHDGSSGGFDTKNIEYLQATVGVMVHKVCTVQVM